MTCGRCGAPRRDDARFCTVCGLSLGVTCHACGFENLTADRFCGGCGRPLELPTRGVPTDLLNADTSFERGSEANWLLLDGERRQATVLFSDLSGYTALHEQLDAEEVELLMGRVKAEAVSIVESLGGMVNQFVGDEVVSLFGIVESHEDDALRAVRAALRLHEAVRVMSPELECRTGQALQLHTGVATGCVITGLSDPRSGRIGVYGETMITGARLATHAANDTILLSPVTRSLLEGFVETESLPPVLLKGRSKTIVPHRLLSLVHGRDRFEIRVEKGLVPLVGRQWELEQLDACLAKAVSGHGQFLTVIGEAGAGKSRLIHEFRQRIDRSRVAVLEGRCLEIGTNTPWLPFLDALRRAFELNDSDSPERSREKVIQGLQALGEDLTSFLPHYLHLLAVPASEHPLPPQLAGESLRKSFEQALTAVLAAMAMQRPMVFILEDWHWSDQASEGVMRTLLRQLQRLPLLVVVLHRREYSADWGDLFAPRILELRSLSKVQSARILGAVLGVKQLPEGIAERIHENTEGNPFFIEELGRSLLEDGTIVVRQGHAELNRTLDKIQLPRTVEALIRTRVDHLSPPLQETLRLGAVIGREFDLALLQSLSQAPDDLEHQLEELCSRELILQSRIVPKPAYSFRHALVQIAVYESILKSRRRELHGALARNIESLHHFMLEPHYEALAHHYSHSNDSQQAVTYLGMAGDRALAGYSIREACRMYQRAVAILERSGSNQVIHLARIDLTLKWAMASHFAATAANVIALEKALALAHDLNDDHRAARLTYWLGRLNYMLGRPVRAADDFERCRSLADSLGDTEMYTLAYAFRGRISYQLGEHVHGIRLLTDSMPLLEELGSQEEQAYSLSMLGHEHSLIGDFSAAYAHHHQAVTIFQAMGNSVAESAALNRVALTHAFRGDWERAIETAHQSVMVAGDSGIVLVLGMATTVRGYALVLHHRSLEGLSLIELGIRRIESSGSLLVLSRFCAWAAEAHALVGDVGQGEQWAERALELVELGDRYGESAAYRSLAMLGLLARPSDPIPVLDTLLRSEMCARSSGEQPELAITLLRRAEVLHRLAEPNRARDSLNEALALFKSMGMDWWTTQAVVLQTTMERREPFNGFLPRTERSELGLALP